MLLRVLKKNYNNPLTRNEVKAILNSTSVVVKGVFRSNKVSTPTLLTFMILNLFGIGATYDNVDCLTDEDLLSAELPEVENIYPLFQENIYVKQFNLMKENIRKKLNQDSDTD